MKTPPELDAIADRVLSYHPKDKAKKLRTKARKAKKGAKRGKNKG